MNDILISKDSKGKIRVVEMSSDWSDESRAYIIRRVTYQYGGKKTEQPLIIISKGKAKRTVTEQSKLEYNSNLNKYKDKGYKELPSNISLNNLEELSKFVEDNISEKTDTNGFKKHMLAKQFEKVSSSTFDKLPYWYASRKIDGVRCSFYLKNGEIVSASRGGKDYDPATVHFREHPEFVRLFNNHPDLILDGELYKPGKSLQEISGAARLEKNAVDCDWLEYYVYDVMDGALPFEGRLELLHELQIELDIKEFDVNKTFDYDDLKVQFVPHEKVKGWINIQKTHDKYVQEGFEGAVIRDPSKLYKFGGRGSEMIKIKQYQEDTFKVVGIEQGLRKYDDMVFVCETLSGLLFNAKPMGDRALKIDYTDNFEKLYLYKYGDCKYFYYSNNDNKKTGVPLQPTFKCFRYDNIDDIDL